MEDWEEGGETEADEHAGSKWSPERGPEFWVHRHKSAAGANCSDLHPIVQSSALWASTFSFKLYLAPIEFLQHWLAIEAIVYTRDEASSNENDNAQVIDLISPLIDL